MTEATNVDNTNLEGAGENQSSVSQEQAKSIAGAPSTSQEFLELKKALELTRSELKGLQGRQDKDKTEVQRFMEDVKAQMAKGKTLEQAEQAVHESREAKSKDDLLYKIAQKVGVLDGSPQNAAGNGSNAADETAKVFEEYNVDPNDPEATPLLALQGVELIKAVSKLALKRAKPSATDSSEASALRTEPAPPASVEAATQKYKEDMLKARGNRALLADIKAKARKGGVPVDSVDFT
jgi:hypothetical protein